MRKVKTQTRPKLESMTMILWNSCPNLLHMRYPTLKRMQLPRQKHLHYYIYSNEMLALLNPENV